jgi:ubiquinone/menaquinone biosynthesis C-methylase UbiE
MNRHSYNAIAKDWDAARSRLLPYERPFLKRLTNNLPRPAKVLDLGCGTGRPVVEFLLRNGHSVTGVDQAEDLLSLARERLPEGRWLQAEMETFAPDGNTTEPSSGTHCSTFRVSTTSQYSGPFCAACGRAQR